jgi:hypothetical protein
MSNSRLELRPWPLIILAYFLGPFVGLNALWATAIVISAVAEKGFAASGAWRGLAGSWLGVMFLGGLVCLVVELIVATPILIAFNRYRWSWLNSGSVAAIGFLTGASPVLALGFWVEWDSLKFRQKGQPDHPLWPIAGPWGRIDLAPPVLAAIALGAVGLIIAIVFRFVAARVARTGPEIWDEFL